MNRRRPPLHDRGISRDSMGTYDGRQNRPQIPYRMLGKRFSNTRRLVVSSQVLLKTLPTEDCDVLLTFPAHTPDDVLMWLLARLRSRAPDIVVHVRHHASSGTYGFYMTASYLSLLKGAEELGLRKPVKEEYGGGMKEFSFEDQDCFETAEDEQKFLSSQERQSILYHMLTNLRAIEGEQLGKIRFLEGQPIVPLLQLKGVVSQVFPLHCAQSLAELRKIWVQAFFRWQPLGKIKEYFGVKIALYFAYLGHYTMFLFLPAALGVGIWFIQGNQETEDWCFVLFALFNVLWATLYLEHFKRRSAELAYQWGTLDKKDELLQDPRPLFTGDLIRSPVTGRLEPCYPSWKRNLFRYLVSAPVVCLCLAVVFAVMLLIFQLQEWVNTRVSRGDLPSFTSFLPKVLLALSIGILDDLYKKVACWLNDMENYRVEETYENHLIIKLVLFQFVNSFLSLFYIAFYLRDMDRLRDQLAALLITRQVVGNLKEALLPYIIWKLRLYRAGYRMTAHMSPATLERQIVEMSGEGKESQVPTKEQPIPAASNSTQENSDLRKRHVGSGSEANTDSSDTSSPTGNTAQKVTMETEQARQQGEGRPDGGLERENSEEAEVLKGSQEAAKKEAGNSPLLTQAEVECAMKKYEDTFEDYLEMFIQFGYVTLFSPAFPLAALCGLLNNVIEVRSDAFKLCINHQRPFGKVVENIGIWQGMLEVMGVIAVMVNCALIGMSGLMQREFPGMNDSSMIVFIVVLEHIILALKLLVAYAIPDIPEWVATEMAKWEFQRRQAFKRLESSVSQSPGPDRRDRAQQRTPESPQPSPPAAGAPASSPSPPQDRNCSSNPHHPGGEPIFRETVRSIDDPPPRLHRLQFRDDVTTPIYRKVSPEGSIAISLQGRSLAAHPVSPPPRGPRSPQGSSEVIGDGHASPNHSERRMSDSERRVNRSGSVETSQRPGEGEGRGQSDSVKERPQYRSHRDLSLTKGVLYRQHMHPGVWDRRRGSEPSGQRLPPSVSADRVSQSEPRQPPTQTPSSTVSSSSGQ